MSSLISTKIFTFTLHITGNHFLNFYNGEMFYLAYVQSNADPNYMYMWNKKIEQLDIENTLSKKNQKKTNMRRGRGACVLGKV
jgi:hypothetical protein